jgi:hypothetical protein
MHAKNAVIWAGTFLNVFVASACLLCLLYFRSMRRRRLRTCKVQGSKDLQQPHSITVSSSRGHMPEIIVSKDLDTQNMILASANVNLFFHDFQDRLSSGKEVPFGHIC